MPRLPPANSAIRLWALATALLAAACASPAEPRRIGLFSSLPILWRESGNLGDHLKLDAAPHWALAVLREQGTVMPVDSFLPGSPGQALRGIDRMVMAQPRPLAPGENVALDAWLRGGGRLLLFADPMLTSGSQFAIGDRRRPEDVVMLSPILGHWGLTLTFDEDQPPGERTAELLGVPAPVNLPGRLDLSGKGKSCRLLSDGLAARCRIGKGVALIVADAALLEDGEPGDLPARRAALSAMLAAIAAY